MLADWDSFWRTSAAEATLIGDAGTHPALVRHWRGVFASLAVDPESTCIDLATGSGIVIRFAQSFFGDCMPRYTGLDRASAAIDRIRGWYPEVEGIVADLTSTGLGARTFDLVTSQFGIEYAGRSAFCGAARLVRGGGTLAVVAHCRPGAVYAECATNLRVIDRLRQSGVFDRARQLFEAAAARHDPAQRRRYSRAGKRLGVALGRLDQLILRYGKNVASGFPVRLSGDLRQISTRLRHYDSQEVMAWLTRLDQETLAYRSRMKAMVDAALCQGVLGGVVDDLGASGLSVIESGPICDVDKELPIAWSIVARRTSV